MMQKETISILLTGVGGQGILLASEITARAAVFAGYDVKTNEVHGMAQRGGSVVAQIRFGTTVFSPLIPENGASVIGSLECIEALRYRRFLAPGGLTVVSNQKIVPVTVSMGSAVYPADAEERLAAMFPRLVFIDAVAKAITLGNIKTANVVFLGALSTGLDLPVASWEESVAACVPERFRDINIRAFRNGRESA